jgi:hypothetical protein
MRKAPAKTRKFGFALGVPLGYLPCAISHTGERNAFS